GGLAVSIAFNGATAGGVIVTPALILLIAKLGVAMALAIAAVLSSLVVVPVAIGVMRRSPEQLGFGPDGDARRPAAHNGAASSARRWRREAIRTWRFWSVSVCFALGLMAQVGVLTHLVALVTPALGST